MKEPDESTHDYAEEVRTVGVAADIPFIKWDRRISLQIGYQFLERDFIEKSGDDYRGKTITTTNLSEENEGMDLGMETGQRRACSVWAALAAPYRQHLRVCRDQLHSVAIKTIFKLETA